MGSVPQFFRKSGESNVLSFSATDGVLQTGYINYYALHGDTDKALSLSQFDSSTPYTQAGASTIGSFAKDIDLDFDIEFKTPQVLKGLGIISYTLYIQLSGGTGVQAYGLVRIRHVNSSGTETDLITAQSWTTNVTGGTYAERITEILTIPQTTFAVGDKLRITFEVWANLNAASSGTLRLYHDPTNRVAVGIASKLYPTYTNHSSAIICAIPFKIDL